MERKIKKYPDRALIIVCAFMIMIGILVLASVSSVLSYESFQNPFFFLWHQIQAGLIPGIILSFLAFKINLTLIRKASFGLFLLNIALLALVLIPGIGVSYGGAARWLDLKLFTFQPSESLKLTFILYFAALMESRFQSAERFSGARKQGLFKKTPRNLSSKTLFRNSSSLILNLFIFLILFGIIGYFLYSQPDISTLFIISVVGAVIYFTAGSPWWHLVLIMMLGASAFWILIKKVPYGLSRITVFLSQDFDPMGKGYQIKQALIAIGSGGLTGLGLGMSRQKFGFLPEAMSDTIFSVIAEELGFLGGATLVLLFMIFLWRGLEIAKGAPDAFSKLLAIGITSWIIVQAIVNIGSIVKLLPPTGVPLPFISYGGSHLVFELIALGLLLNVSKNRKMV